MVGVTPTRRFAVTSPLKGEVGRSATGRQRAIDEGHAGARLFLIRMPRLQTLAHPVGDLQKLRRLADVERAFLGRVSTR